MKQKLEGCSQKPKNAKDFWLPPEDEGNGKPLQQSCLENAMDGGATVRYHITPTRMAITVKNQVVGKVKKLESLNIVGGNIKCFSCYGKGKDRIT